VKACLLLCAAVALAAGQSNTAKYQVDINGRRVELTSSGVSAGGVHTERLQSINGRPVPVEQVEEKVIREGPGGRVVERLVRKYEQTGRLNYTERTVIEEEKLAGGGSNVRETTYRSDINGAMREAERRFTETRVAGGVTTTETAVSRPNINGGFETSERRTKVSERLGQTENIQEIVRRPDPDGRLRDAIRTLTVIQQSGDQTAQSTSTYELGMTGQLELASQSSSAAVKRPDGSEVTEINLFARSADGRTQSRGAPLQIKEQQIVERQKNADGSVVETLSVRRPSIADPGRLGAPRKLFETVCTGKCD
jgi:hypothetical protein